MSPAVSVIVPVYNASRYLGQCLESLIHQTLNDVEYIFVDDGSTDRSLDILKEYQKKDRRITILQQKKQYAGVARNHGLEMASGEYISFLDADDFFDLRMLQHTYTCAKKNQAEIVIFGYKHFDDKIQKVKNYNLRQGNSFPKGVFSAEDMGERIYQINNQAAWNKLFSRRFLENWNLHFESLKKCEDACFTCMALALAERMTFINKRYVSYRTNNQQSSQGARDKDRKTFVDVGISIKEGLKKAGKFNGGIRKSEIRYAMSLIGYGVLPPYTKTSLEDYYAYAKGRMIPGVFDAISDIEDNSTAKNIYESMDFCDFLCRQLQMEIVEKETNYISADSLEARTGKTFLKIPKRILKIIKRY